MVGGGINCRDREKTKVTIETNTVIERKVNNYTWICRIVLFGQGTFLNFVCRPSAKADPLGFLQLHNIVLVRLWWLKCYCINLKNIDFSFTFKPLTCFH